MTLEREVACKQKHKYINDLDSPLLDVKHLVGSETPYAHENASKSTNGTVTDYTGTRGS